MLSQNKAALVELSEKEIELLSSVLWKIDTSLFEQDKDFINSIETKLEEAKKKIRTLEDDEE